MIIPLDFNADKAIMRVRNDGPKTHKKKAQKIKVTALVIACI